MAIREGAWDCPACGRKRNRGPEKHCAGCGTARAADVRFYLPDDAPEVTDPAALERARRGPDWRCNFCGADNRADYTHCTGCGASSDGTPRRPVIEYRDTPQEKPPKKTPKKKRHGCLKVGCLGILLTFLALLFLGGAEEVTLTADRFAWERTAHIEARVTVTEEAWEDEVPSGAQVLERRQEQRALNPVPIGTETKTRKVTERVQVGTEQVKVGVRDLGNGYFEDIYEDRPVYETVEREESYEAPVYSAVPTFDTKIRYEIDRWQPRREIRLGDAGRPGRWLELDLARDERVSKIEALYTVFFTDPEGKSYRWETRDEEAWRGIREGGRYRVKAYTGSGKVTKILGAAD